MHSVRWTFVALLSWSLHLAGCSGEGVDGPPVVPVSGVLTLDGKPMEGATIVFSPKGEGTMSMAIADTAGKFQLKTGSGRNGAVVGDHNIGVILSITSGAPLTTPDGLAPPLPSEMGGGGSSRPANAGPRTVWMIPEKYSKPDSSGLSVTVPAAGLTDYKLELKK